MIGHQAFLEHAEPGAGADVGAEPDPDPEVEMAAQREQPAPQECVARGAVGDGGAGRGEAAQLGIADVDIVGKDRERAHETEALVRLEVVLRPREQRTHELDLARTFVQMGGHQHAGGSARQMSADVEHRLGA